MNGAPGRIDHRTQVRLARDEVQHDLRRVVLAPFQLWDAIPAAFLLPQLFYDGAVLVILPTFEAVGVLVGDVVDGGGQPLVGEKVAEDAYLLQRRKSKPAK